MTQDRHKQLPAGCKEISASRSAVLYPLDRKIKAKVLYVLCRTDRLFPPAIAPGVMNALDAAGVEARYFEIDSELGHSASGPEHAKWSPVLRAFLAPLMPAPG